jgi:hypothetical protein
MYHSKRIRFLTSDYRPHQKARPSYTSPEDARKKIYKLTFLDLNKDDRDMIYNLTLDVRRGEQGFLWLQTTNDRVC